MILAIDVTSARGIIAWRSEGNRGHSELSGRKHAETLAPELERLCKTSTPKALGVVTGPGSFTGIRIGLATCLGMKMGWQIPLYACSRFDLLWWHVGCPAVPCGLALPQHRVGYWTEIRRADGNERDQCDELDSSVNWYRDEGFELTLLVKFVELIWEGRLQEPTVLEPCYVRPPDAARGVPILAQLLGTSQNEN